MKENFLYFSYLWHADVCSMYLAVKPHSAYVTVPWDVLALVNNSPIWPH